MGSTCLIFPVRLIGCTVIFSVNIFDNIVFPIQCLDSCIITWRHAMQPLWCKAAIHTNSLLNTKFSNALSLILHYGMCFSQKTDDTIQRCLFRIAKFADGLTAYRNYSSSVSNSLIQDDLKPCQAVCHHCGVSRRITFDASKEYFCILHKLHCSGDTFGLLGILIDPKLTI